MIKNILTTSLIILSFSFSNIKAQNTLSPEIIKKNFNYDYSKANFDFLKNEINFSYDKKSKTDFSQIPDYSFAYLNNLIVNAINTSVKSFDGVMYSITLKDVPDALISAKNRGVKIRLIIDEKHVYPKMDTNIKKLIDAGSDVRTLRGTRSYGVNHNKITIHDGELLTVGSYNWTFSATFYNYENLLVIRNPYYVEAYKKYFEWMWSNSRTIAQGPSEELPEGYYGTPLQDENPKMSLNGNPVPAYLFSPGSDTENKVAKLIDSTKKTLDAVTFTFSSKPIADAIVRAQKRGVKIRFLEDIKMAKESSMAKYIYENLVPFKWTTGRSEKGAMHNKFLIFDEKILATGSFNFTTNASVNSFENLIFVNDPVAIKAYQDKFDFFYSNALTPNSISDFNI